MRPRTHLDGIIIATPPTAWHREQAQEYFRAQEDRDPHTIAEARAPHYEGSAWYDEADEPQPTRPLTRGSQLGGVGGVIIARRPSDNHYARAEAHYAQNAQLRKRRADRGSGDGGRREGSRELVVRVYREELGSVPSLASYKA